jgi:Na+-transporting methylmalonyl-CoA/oxaloacetate decarboxylase gamma subunit
MFDQQWVVPLLVLLLVFLILITCCLSGLVMKEAGIIKDEKALEEGKEMFVRTERRVAEDTSHLREEARQAARSPRRASPKPQPKPQSSQDLTDQQFALMDTNDDGVVTRAEFRAYEEGRRNCRNPCGFT